MRDPLFWQSAKVTALYAVLLVPLLYVSGLGLALLVQKTNRFNGIVRSMFFAPHMVSLVVVALVWQFLVVDKIGVLSRLRLRSGSAAYPSSAIPTSRSSPWCWSASGS
jgi:multiple sugar transport system permease protein